MENRVKFKIGEIEFEADGSEEVIERERNVFLNTLLPAAVDAIIHTHKVTMANQYIKEPENVLKLEPSVQTIQADDINIQQSNDLSRTSLASFLRDFGPLNDQDFVLISAYYDEKKNSTKFSLENVKKYYSEGRRTGYSNISALLNQLAKKGYIMDAPNSEGKKPKQYMLTDEGLAYVDSYQPKKVIKGKKMMLKSKKIRNKVESIYAKLNVDDLNLKNYPRIKEQDSFRKQMILILYIVSKENHGDEFSITDVQCLMTDILGLPATEKQIQGVFTRNKTWFKKERDQMNKKAYKHKLLEGAKDFAKSIIDEELKSNSK